MKILPTKGFKIYSAKLLFQFRVVEKNRTFKRRVCEERIVLFEAKTPKLAVRKAKSIGRSEQFDDHRNNRDVFFEFIGILELMEANSIGDGEVWWELKEMVSPMERRDKIIPPESDLDVLSTVMRENKSTLSIYGSMKNRA